MEWFSNLVSFYQHLPSHVTPYLYEGSTFSLRWYSVGYILAFLTTYLVAAYRLKKEGHLYEGITLERVETFILMSVIGVIFGGRVAYVFIYGYDSFKGDLFHAFIPIVKDQDSWLGYKMLGYSGMSYHGGFAGVVLATYLFVRMYKLDFYRFGSLIAPGVALGYFWGRFGNFMNGELYGRVTEMPWGMYFSYSGLSSMSLEQKYLRHPSQLYEGFCEGFLLFLILWQMRKKEALLKYIVPAYFMGYGFFRFFIEFFRQPDQQFRDENDTLGTVLGFMTMGQVLCIIMILIGLGLAFHAHHREKKKNA